PSHDQLMHGDRIVVDYTEPVTIIEGPHAATVYTVGKTVKEVLADTGLELGEYDRTEPALDEPVSAGELVRIIRVQKVTEFVEKDIPYAVVTTSDHALAKGKEKIMQEGKEGVLIETI